MSLVAIATRIAMVNALEGKTSAGFVLDAPKEPIDSLGEKPVIAVYTGAIKFTPGGRGLYGEFGRPTTMEMVLQLYLPAGNVVVEGLGLNVSDAGAGFGMDLLWRQVTDALSDPTSAWAEIYRLLVQSYSSFSSQPVLVENERGQRYPCREIHLGCDVIQEPTMGMPLNANWQKIDAALRTQPETIPVADVIKAVIERPADLPTWRAIQAREGMSDAEIRAVAIGPADDDLQTDPPSITAVEVDAEPASGD
ncbi:hypothetical protein [Ancylobacter amanitiformis]|uniref:Uncharacterized protein n=1 Tax=Ancylobacter amanitiformis TaxID=217069 RepID=A0ABU0LQL7_9HYPH|nr:hypothetical protein [Ancylobacter amanitiformis]MDQ0510883.1 hypothetical protein [Ancylobacter amanitiformis]